MNHSWWWHLWNDPMSSNPWSFLMLMVIVGGSGCLLWAIAAKKQ